MVLSLCLIQAAISCERCSLSKRRAERSECKSKAIASLQEHVDIMISMLSEGSEVYADVDQLSDFLTTLGEECLLCEGQNKIIHREIHEILKASRELDLDMLTREEKKIVSNVIKFRLHDRK